MDEKSNELIMQVNEIRASLRNLSKDALSLHQLLKLPKEQFPLRDALMAVSKNCERAIKEGKTVAGESDLLPWIVKRIESVTCFMEKLENNERTSK